MSSPVTPPGSFGSKLSLKGAELPNLDAEFEKIDQAAPRVGVGDAESRDDRQRRGPPQVAEHISNKNQQRDLANRFKDAKHPFKIAKFIPGFRIVGSIAKDYNIQRLG